MSMVSSSASARTGRSPPDPIYTPIDKTSLGIHIRDVVPRAADSRVIGDFPKNDAWRERSLEGARHVSSRKEQRS
jgi:hypothetical protein